MFTQWLVKQWLTEKKAQELLKQAWWKPNEFRKLLEKAGISPELAADSAVNVFDYYGVTKTARKVGSMVAYFNSAASQAKSTKTLFEKNPRLMSMMMSGWALLSHQIYNFNTNTPEKKAAYDQMPAYRRNSPMLYMGKNEKNEDVFIKMVRWLQILDWSYPLYIESKDSATKSGFNFEEAFSKMFEDTVGIKPNPADWGQYLPAVVKQWAENVTWFNMFFKSHRNVSADAKQFATQDFDKNTSRVAMWMSRTFAKITWWVEGPDGVIRGWIQFSPIKVDNLMNSADNGTVRGIAGKFLFKSEREWKIDKKELFNVVGHFKKLGNEQRNSKGIFEERNKAKAESSARNRNIDRILLESEDLGESIKELISLYPKSADTIKRKVKKAIKQDLVSDILKNENPLYVRDLITTSSFNNAEIAQVYNGRLTDEGEKKADKFLVDMVKSWLITKDKLKTIYREIFTSQ